MRALLYISIVLFISSCAQEKQKMLKAFEEQHLAIRAGEIDQFYDFVDDDTQAFIDELTDADNMNPDKLKEIGRKYGLDYWVADYYSTASEMVKANPSRDKFFYYLANTTTPLFSYMTDYELDKTKSRVGEKNYILLGNEYHGYRNVTWLEYIINEGKYQLKLLDVLKQSEAKKAKEFFGYAKTQYDNRPPKDWKDKSLDELYRMDVFKTDLSKDTYNKNDRPKQ